MNHYFEPALAMAVLIPTGVARLATVWKSESPLASFATVFVLVLLLPSLDMQRSYFMHNKPDNLQPLARMMGKRRVFTDIPYLAARTPTLELLEPASLMNTERAGGRVGWSSALIAEALQEKKYELVILSFPVDAAYDPFDTYPRYTHLDTAVRGGDCSRLPSMLPIGHERHRWQAGNALRLQYSFADVPRMGLAATVLLLNQLPVVIREPYRKPCLSAFRWKLVHYPPQLQESHETIPRVKAAEYWRALESAPAGKVARA